MEYTYKNHIVRLKKPPCFSLEQIFNCGQAFRFFKEGTGYIGVAFNRVIPVYETDDEVVIENTSLEDFLGIWRDFFDLERDYDAFAGYFSKDEVMNRAIAFGKGIRILHQDTWEALVTFIISQQNNIPRITGIVSALCENFGDPIFYSGKTYYSFPSPEKLSSLTIDDLSVLKCGFRAKYILTAARMIHLGDISFDAIRRMDTPSARKELQKITGVGPKVADCTLLFGAGRFDAFPVDVWIGRVIDTLYQRDTFTPDIFGPYCGIAQQYLFYYGREQKIGKK